MAAVLSAAGHLLHGNNAAIELFAAHVFELDGGVADMEAFLEHIVERGQDARALRQRNVGDGHVAGQRAGV